MKKLKHTISSSLPLFLLTFYLVAPPLNVGVARVGGNSGESTAGENPFTPKAHLIRYWKKHISNDLPKPWFLLNKASPLTPVQLATFSKLADQNSLSTQLPAFCKSANLFCFPDLSPSLEKHNQDVKFKSYADDRNFTNYGSDRANGLDSFDKYNDIQLFFVDTFTGYSRNSTRHGEKFSSYTTNSDGHEQSFNNYGTSSNAGNGDFNNYNNRANVAQLRFTSYSDHGNGRTQTFNTYNNNSNSGDERFTSYAKNENGARNEFNSYGNSSNVINSKFTNYGETGNSVNDVFTSYGSDGNVPHDHFKAYGNGGNAAVDTFKNYHDNSNDGDESFQSYGKGSNAAEVNFMNYGRLHTGGSNEFKGYVENAKGQSVGFKIYGLSDTFKEYAHKGVSFAKYMNVSSRDLSPSQESGKVVKNNKSVEPGKFFREKMLRTGVVMPMPDIIDKMPPRSFLPRAIVSKVPFSTAKVGQLKGLFNAKDNSIMAKMLTDSLSECERAPSPGETKQCISSIEDMIDFATSVLGQNVAVRTTENTKGSNSNIMIGSVRATNGGKVTKSVSCHQSLFPSLLYYCHSVPKVRVYETDILDLISKVKINHGVAICHINTSTWSSNHGAFMALGSSPGKIEVCHWIFENDMTWTIAD